MNNFKSQIRLSGRTGGSIFFSIFLIKHNYSLRSLKRQKMFMESKKIESLNSGYIILLNNKFDGGKVEP